MRRGRPDRRSLIVGTVRTLTENGSSTRLRPDPRALAPKQCIDLDILDLAEPELQRRLFNPYHGWGSTNFKLQNGFRIPGVEPWE